MKISMVYEQYTAAQGQIQKSNLPEHILIHFIVEILKETSPFLRNSQFDIVLQSRPWLNG